MISTVEVTSYILAKLVIFYLTKTDVPMGVEDSTVSILRAAVHLDPRH